MAQFVSIVVVALMVLSWPDAAWASPDYPLAITNHLMSRLPSCIVCHTNTAGGKGTVTRPFGISMRAHGLVSANAPSLVSALDAMAADKTDSLCDGTPDIDDLKAGRDPNVADSDAGLPSCNSTAQSGVTPTYGCGARIAPRQPSSLREQGVSVWFASAIVMCRRSRRRSRSRP